MLLLGGISFATMISMIIDYGVISTYDNNLCMEIRYQWNAVYIFATKNANCFRLVSSDLVWLQHRTTAESDVAEYFICTVASGLVGKWLLFCCF